MTQLDSHSTCKSRAARTLPIPALFLLLGWSARCHFVKTRLNRCDPKRCGFGPREIAQSTLEKSISLQALNAGVFGTPDSCAKSPQELDRKDRSKHEHFLISIWDAETTWFRFNSILRTLPGPTVAGQRAVAEPWLNSSDLMLP